MFRYREKSLLYVGEVISFTNSHSYLADPSVHRVVSLGVYAYEGFTIYASKMAELSLALVQSCAYWHGTRKDPADPPDIRSCDVSEARAATPLRSNGARY